MKNLIQVLPKKIINQIAAGEIIERPSSIFKELLENSIDANAKKIDIFIKDSGNIFIQLVDDGKGMNINDARMSIKKHATSKIENIDDLFNIKTKGFRGEALFSIALISQLEIQTKDKKSFMGIHLFVEDGSIKKEIPINMKSGTRVTVKNIFYKFPARRRFLKSYNVEFNSIIKEFYKIVLAHRDIVYRFYHNDKIMFFFEKNSLKKRIQEIFNEKDKNLKYISINKKKFSVRGFITIPGTSVKKGNQFILVNERCVTYMFLHKKIIHAYNGIIKDFNKISYFIFICANPSIINYNIHPSKKKVIIETENDIGILIQREIKNILFFQYKVNEGILNNYSILHNYINIEKNFLYRNIKINENKKSYCINYHTNVNVKKLCFYVLQKKKIETFQVNKKYILFTFKNDNMVLVDQHRAHKHILFEFFLVQKNIISEKCFPPIKIKFLKKELYFFKNFKIYLENFGFYLSILDKHIYLYKIPKKIEKSTIYKMFKNILISPYIVENMKKNKKMFVEFISIFSSIKHGTILCSKKMETLIRDIFSCKNPTYTSSGKPIFFVFNKNFFQKIF
ncbi:DNA mismatch repair endonuclease MutL [Blattabacterium cuenoti]|uniref:DNA mismatch repair endonuclease MutL n=1 Tax=Blattabacterium cuenoti TaxID=1653831 RepID=UPI00163D1BA7|nr:DNA mismatch repair endonuclease MutL [Blattabacterium cuenoti]